MDKSKNCCRLAALFTWKRGGKAQQHPGLCFSRPGFEQALGAQTGRA